MLLFLCFSSIWQARRAAFRCGSQLDRVFCPFFAESSPTRDNVGDAANQIELLRDHHAGAAGSRHQFAGLARDRAFDETNAQSALDHAGSCDQQSLADGTNEVILHFDGRKILVVREGPAKGNAHRSVSQSGDQAAVELAPWGYGAAPCNEFAPPLRRSPPAPLQSRPGARSVRLKSDLVSRPRCPTRPQASELINVV